MATVVDMMAEGIAVEESPADYPDLKAGDVREALEYAAEAERENHVPLRRGA